MRKQDAWRKTARYATMASAVSILVSIPVSQIFLGLALLCLLAAGTRWRWVDVYLPLGCFLGWMLVSLAASPEPLVGLPQVKKLYVFLVLPVALAALPAVRDYLCVFAGWVLVACASALLALGQFGWKYMEARETGQAFYEAYVGQRITGFMSHWMTFSGQAMLVTLLLLAYALVGPRLRRWHLAGVVAALGLLLSGVVLGYTRGIWIATAIASLPLLWSFRRWMALAAPVAFVLLLAFGPASVQDRFLSIFKPRGETDSNQHRVVTFATGVAMMQAHPLLGLGPERVGSHVEEYAPSWIRRPFPEGYYGHLHNIYVHYGAERGMPAVLFLLWIFGRLLWDQWQALAQAQRPRSLSRALHLSVFSAVVAVMVGGLFEYNLGDSEILTMFLVIVAAGYSSGPSPGSTEESGRSSSQAASASV
ncbi:MAG: O-antigen ligase family protein [Bryobacterales bacterium]|nr:O-antigen ligase family protein [Bryobacterales bacterium]